MIVITGAMMASAAIAGGGSALSAYGDYQKNRAALRRSNRQAEARVSRCSGFHA